MSNVIDKTNLNFIPFEEGDYPDDNSVIDDSKDIQVFFKNLELHLITEIRKSCFVLGCIAWLTNENILKELSKIKNVSIVIQKEDFLRPDYKQKFGWKTKLRNQYNRLTCKDILRYHLDGIGRELSIAGDPDVHPVRCVGNHNKDKSPAFPRMHNKFLIFGDKIIEDDGYGLQYRSVWTGSFNLTKNATFSLENAVLIKNKEIINAYAKEFSNIYALSESLDWESDWVAPEYRIGT